MPLAIVSTSAFQRLLQKLNDKIVGQDEEPYGIKIEVINGEMKWEGMSEDEGFSMYCNGDFELTLLKTTIKNAILILQRVVDHPATVFFDTEHAGIVFKHLTVI